MSHANPEGAYVNTKCKVIQLDRPTIYLYILCGYSGKLTSMIKLSQRPTGNGLVELKYLSC
jgi:hypothetical protein